MSSDELEKKQRIFRLAELLCLVVFVFGLQLMGDLAHTWLRYDRALIEAGQWWRLFSGNYVHLSSNHMLMNISVLVLATLLFRPNVSGVLWHGVIVALSFTVGIGLLLFDPEVARYVGFSGVLYGLFAFGLLVSLKDNLWLYCAALAFVVYKVLAQQGAGYQSEDVEKFIGGHVIASAHLFGLAGGIAIGLAYAIKTNSWKHRVVDENSFGDADRG